MEEALKVRSNITWRYSEIISVGDKCASDFPDFASVCIALA